MGGNVGRSEWRPWKGDFETCFKAGQLRLTQKELAKKLGIAESTWYEKIKEFPELIEQYESGKLDGKARMSNVVYEKGLEGNIPAALAYLKQSGWTEPLEVTGRAGEPVQVQIVLPSNGHEAKSDATPTPRPAAGPAD